jgi:hypothetical protein
MAPSTRKAGNNTAVIRPIDIMPPISMGGMMLMRMNTP